MIWIAVIWILAMLLVYALCRIGAESEERMKEIMRMLEDKNESTNY
jgi:hypothetical protein